MRRLVLNNDDDAAVLYFKALQWLNYFSDAVRSAQTPLGELALHSRETLFGNEWLGYEYNADKEDTKAILDHNWKMVKQRQRDASTRILQMLERTTNEVKSLQSGVSNRNDGAQDNYLHTAAVQCPVNYCRTEILERNTKEH